MSQSATAPRRRPRGRKQGILDAARGLFVEFGYPNVSMAMIAEQVDITAGALYRHYSNKAALLEAVFEDGFQLLVAPSTSESIDEFFDDAVRRDLEGKYVAELWRSEARYLPDESQEVLRTQLLSWTGRFSEMLLRRRPDLSPLQSQLIAWAMQSTLVRPQVVRSGLSNEHAREMVLGALETLGDVRLLPFGERDRPEEESIPAVHSTRERLLLAAIQHFGENGFRASSIIEIGATAGVTGPNLYGYFADKKALFQEAFTRGVHASWIAMNRAISASRTAEECVWNVVREHVSLDKLWTQVRLNVTLGDDTIREYMIREQSEYLAEWIETLRAARPELTKPEAHFRVLMAFTIVEDLQRTRFLARREGFRENLARLVVAVMLEDYSTDHRLSSRA